MGFILGMQDCFKIQKLTNVIEYLSRLQNKIMAIIN